LDYRSDPLVRHNRKGRYDERVKTVGGMATRRQ
jgi:hypothetical protein